MKNIKYLIIGCGRSGTGFLSSVITLSGKYCSHEKIFDEAGLTVDSIAQEHEYESSWYAVPYLITLPSHIKILHVTREPQKVINSFYRIGIFSRFGIPFITQGKFLKFIFRMIFHPIKVIKKINYFLRHQHYVDTNMKFEKTKNEFKFIENYWFYWNKEIERFCSENNNPYMRIKIEDFDDKQSEIEKFLNLKIKEHTHSNKNHKQGYNRKVFDSIKLSNRTKQLAKLYGYKV